MARRFLGKHRVGLAHHKRKVRNQYCVNARLGGTLKKGRHARRKNEVCVKHDAHRCCFVFGAEGFNHFQALFRGGAVADRAVGACDNHRAVGTRIRKGNAELKRICACGHQCFQNPKARCFIGIAEIDKGDKSAVSFLRKTGKGIGKTVSHIFVSFLYL